MIVEWTAYFTTVKLLEKLLLQILFLTLGGLKQIKQLPLPVKLTCDEKLV